MGPTERGRAAAPTIGATSPPPPPPPAPVAGPATPGSGPAWSMPAGPPTRPLPYGPSADPSQAAAAAPPPGWAPAPPAPGSVAPAAGAGPAWNAPGSGSLPPAPPGWGPALPVYGAAPPPPPNAPVTKGRSRAALAILSVTAVLAASTFAFVALTRPDGSASAEEAVEKLFESIEQEDAIGVMESLPPGEREVLLDPMVAAVGELQRLGLLDSFQLEDVPGADIEVDGLTLSSTNLGSGVTKVRVTGGTITGTVIPDQVPIGPKTRELAERQDEDIDIQPESSTESLAESDLELVAVEEDGGWHVSLFYTIAEYARGDDQPLPQFGAGTIAAVGADTPEGAVRGLVEAGLALDLGGAVGYLPPDEMRVLYDYVPLFLDEANEGADEARAEGYTASLDRLDLHAEGDGDTRRVAIDAVDIVGGADDTSMRYAWDGSCTTTELTSPSYSGSFAPIDPETGRVGEPEPTTDETTTTRIEVCTDGRVTITEDGVEQEVPDIAGLWGRSAGGVGPFGVFSPFGTTGDLGQAVTVVEQDGRWYVSPVRTVSDSILGALRGLDGSDIDEFFDSFDSMLAPSERFESVGEPFPGGGGTIPMPDPDNPYTVCSEQVFGNLDPSSSPDDVDRLDDAFEQCLIEHGEEPYVAPEDTGPPRIVGDHVVVPGEETVRGYTLDGTLAWEGPASAWGAWGLRGTDSGSDTAVLICESDDPTTDTPELVALDPQNGNERWRRPATGDGYARGYQWGLSVGPTVVLQLGTQGVQVLDLRTGEERFAVNEPIAGAAADDTAVYLTDGLRLLALDAVTGDERWTLDWQNTGVDVIPGAVVTRSAFGVVHLLDPATGTAVWSNDGNPGTLGEVGRVLAVTDDTLLVGSTNDDRVVFAYDLATGAKRWQREGVEELTADAGASTAVVFDVEDGEVVLLDVHTGEVRRDVELPPTAWAFDISGDVLAFSDHDEDGNTTVATVRLP